MTVTRIEPEGFEHADPGDAVPGVRTTRPLAAVGLSLLWPGSGHAFLGRTGPAAGFVTAQVVLVVLSVLPGLWRVTVPAWVLLVTAAAWSAGRSARGHRPG